jgi:hypothetical protein
VAPLDPIPKYIHFDCLGQKDRRIGTGYRDLGRLRS